MKRQPTFAALQSAMGRCASRLLAAVGAALLLGGAHTPLGGADARILAAHNRERAALNLPPLAWEDSLAADAKAWAATLAQTGQLAHAPQSGGSGQGENLWMGTAGRFAAEQMVGAWSAERAQFRHGVFPQVSATGDWADVGHYTQMIWRDTTHLGCAVASGPRYDALVCRYARPGNVMGRAPY
ncbi:SCP-like extracellular [Erythrobacteraceae bacterium CFH 75059]|uniref:CAP domain-containing protein n=1 Tax=Qipengyuania thermophila TaxID=2509361 RepID=UPI00102104A2|nr:CAP domain-containing protein [Qipengyuania thermophila]TCD06323.1 SCP-like extracellular [Erythrobacteraceae bacterium CFH 75059]